MSGPPPSMVGLDARAAELKEKLLKSRGQSRPKTARLKTDDVNTTSNVTTSTVPKATSAGPPASDETKAARVTPPKDLMPTTPHSLQADEDDIAALISSISGAAARESEVNSSHPLSDSLQQEKMATVKVATTSAAPTSGNKDDGLPPKPAPRPVPKISIPKPEAVEPQSTPSTQQVTCAPAATETKQRTPTSPGLTQKQNKQLDRAPTAFTRNPAEKQRNVRENAGSAVPPASKAPPALETTRKVAERDDTKNGNSLVDKTVPDRGISQLPKASIVNSHQETGRERTNPTSTNVSTRDRADSRKIPAKPMAPPAAVNPTTLATDTGAVGATANGKHTGHPDTISSDEAFTRLLNQVPDLRDFLEMSDYYDVEARTRKLTRFRRLKALAAERLRLEEEERKLMQEEEIDMGLQRSTIARFTSVAPSAASDMETNSLPTPITPVPNNNSIGTRDMGEPTSANGTKRAREEDAPRDRQEKAPRLEEHLPPRGKDMDNRSRHDDRYRESDRRDDPRRDSRSRPDDHASRSPPLRRRHRDEDDYEGRQRYDSYKDDDRRHRDSESRSKYPVRVGLGYGDSRFFIVKSFNYENVRICMEENLWTTNVQNEEIYTEAFAKCKNVILFFSINGSKAFQGYARMASAPSKDNPRPSFAKGSHWDTSGPFRVQWLSKTSVHFSRIGHLKNAYNEYRPVLVGKDGQEIDEDCGPKLLREMEDIAEAEAPGWGESGGGGGGGGNSWGRYGEREGEKR